MAAVSEHSSISKKLIFAHLKVQNAIYLNNPNLIHALAKDKSNIGNLRETFFIHMSVMLLNFTYLKMEIYT